MSQDHEKLKPFSLSLPLSPHSQLRKSLLVSLTLRELHTHKIPSSHLPTGYRSSILILVFKTFLLVFFFVLKF